MKNAYTVAEQDELRRKGRQLHAELTAQLALLDTARELDRLASPSSPDWPNTGALSDTAAHLRQLVIDEQAAALEAIARTNKERQA